MTRKDLQDRSALFNARIFRAGYCRLQYILQSPAADRAFGYNSGLYGWNWDAYNLRDKDGNNVIICTGHRNLVGDDILAGICNKYNTAADEIVNKKYPLFSEERKTALINLFYDFLDEIQKQL